MLQQLDIHNIAIIDKVCIEFGGGLNVLTGETGAGKSIIIDSINAILGQRVSKELIRSGKEKALIEALFIMDKKECEFIEGWGIEPEDDGTLLISREFSISGKNICRVNGKIVTVSILKEIGERLIDIHGQHDNQSLLRTESHIYLLDAFAENSIIKLKDSYNKHMDSYTKIRQKLKAISGGDPHERERKVDLLKFQIDEIKKAKLKVSEEEELLKQRDIMSNSEKIINSLSKAYQFLGEGGKHEKSALDSINDSLASFHEISSIDERYDNIQKRIEALVFEAEDIVSEIRSLRDGLEYNPALLEEIEERLDLIYRLKKKYGDTIADVIEYAKNAKLQLDEIINNEEIIIDLKKELSIEDENLYKICKSINSERIKAAKVLEKSICAELEDLEMKNAALIVNIEFDDSINENEQRKYTVNGLDKVEFLVCTNKGEPLKPLSKIASGGEMSRIMLAIKTILANVDNMPTLIFDEIDIGISGKAAQKVGEKLAYLSKGHQVISVTHLAQIACMADNHFLIEKIIQDNNTNTKVRKLEKEHVKNEIARIIGGANITEITIKHAEEMLKGASQFKSR